jgi:surfeit locus 1 family protein
MTAMRSKSLFWPTVVTIAGLATLIGLGTWQLQRLAWKTGLIATVESRVNADPIAMPSRVQWPLVDLEQMEYRPVTATGAFDHAGEAHIFTQLPQARGRNGGPGFWIIAPFRLDDGGTVLVNRGFVPREFEDPSTRPEGQVTGTVTLTGLIRRPERQQAFVPDNDPARNIWFFRDIAAMASAAGYPEAAPFLLDERANAIPGGLPQAGETRLVFKNDHLQYALTWYGLALCLAGIYIALWIGARRSGDGDRAANSG